MSLLILLFFILSIIAILLLVLVWIERGHIVLPSTYPALKFLGLKRILKGDLVHALAYGRWTPQYIKFISVMAPHIGKSGRRWLENTYHGKVLPPKHARSIITIEKDIPLQDLGERVIPYSRARNIVLSAPPDIVITRCGCKTMRNEPCKRSEPPYLTCMLIGKPLTDFQLEHHPKTSRRITQAEALELLKDFHERGLVHNAWFKDCIKDQFYVICNCCPCCCLGIESYRRGIRQITSSGYVAIVEESKCKGCGTCVSICPFKALSLNSKGRCVVDTDKCKGCNICVSKCPNNARKIVRDLNKSAPLDVNELSNILSERS